MLLMHARWKSIAANLPPIPTPWAYDQQAAAAMHNYICHGLFVTPCLTVGPGNDRCLAMPQNSRISAWLKMFVNLVRLAPN